MSVMVATVAIFAFFSAFSWFAVSQANTVQGIGVSIEDIAHSGYVISHLSSGRITEEALVIYPDTVLTMNVQSIIENNEGIGIRVDIEPMTSENFQNYFSKRNDLLVGQYQKANSFDNFNSQRYYDFDIDEHLSNYFKGDPNINDKMKQSKINFLNEFTKQNSMHDTLTIQITRIGGVLLLDGSNEPDPIIFNRYNGSDPEYKDVYFPSRTFSIVKDDIIEIQIVYGNGYLPKIVIEDSSATCREFIDYNERGKTFYDLLNYNCFIGQHMYVSFVNSTPQG